MLALENYLIDDFNHCILSAQEGFFTDDKNPQITTTNSPEETWEVQKYKDAIYTNIGPKWVDNFLKYWERTTDRFVKGGLTYLKEAVANVVEADKFVTANESKYLEAFKAKDTATMQSIRVGLQECFKELTSYNRSFNNGSVSFAGDRIPMPENLKTAMRPLLTTYAKIYSTYSRRDVTNLVTDYKAKSTLKKTFGMTKIQNTLQNKDYLDAEMYLWCKDIHTTLSRYNLQ